MQNSQYVQLAAKSFLDTLGRISPDFRLPKTALILGTGLSPLIHRLSLEYEAIRIPFSDIHGFPLSTVESHEGSFLLSSLGGLPILVQQGRIHLYEGYSPDQVCMGVRMMAQLGIKTLIITNAAGALNPNFKAGTLMCLNDFINFTGLSPLTGPNNPAWGERFPDFSQPFDPELIQIVNSEALELGIRMENGVYIGVRGPEMETPAETRMYRNWGADAIGMSTVLETIAARHCGMAVLGISCLTNKNLPDCMTPAPLDEIIRVANECGADLSRLLEKFCESIASRQP